MKHVAALASALFGLALAASAHAYCPSYTPAITATGQKCGVDPAPGTNPTVAQWQQIFLKAAGGKATWGNDGPDIQTIGSGCGKPKPRVDVPAHFPCQLIKAIAMQESVWQQFCVPDTPASQVGQPERTIVSFDCGYGVGQVTTGMHVGETPAFDRKRVASDAQYNLSTGMLILRDKWSATACVGDNDPDVVEDWYTATWAYNGLAYSNNPNNPNLKANRGPYNPKNGGAYAYQERIWGWMEFPPTPQHWTAMQPAYPNRGDIGTSGAPPALPEPSCASPTSCAQTRSVHPADCGTAPVADAGPVIVDDSGAVVAPEDDAGIAAQPTTSAGGAEGGCSCRAAARSDAGSIAWGAFAAVALIVTRRRAARRPPAEPRATRSRRSR